MAELGIVCGMVSEVRALGVRARDRHVAVAVSGGDPERAEAEARRLIAGGARRLLSWGIAGALHESFLPGKLLCPGEVVDGTGGCWQLHGPLEGTWEARVLGSDRLVADPSEKARLWRETGAVAVDMESHRVARAGAAAGVPVAVVRAVSDPADRALPALAATALGPDGRVRIGRVLAGLARRPGDLPSLIAAGRDSRAALAALARVADEVVGEMLDGPA